jgi:UDP-N-acetylmuramate--alanine ligase
VSIFQVDRRVHVMGAGGAGMSGLALLLGEMGASVSACDAVDSPVLEELRAHHIPTFVGHDASHVEGVEVLTWSPAVALDDPEVGAARSTGVRLVTRAGAFNELATMKRVIGLCGTHGKTTATSMMVQVSLAAGRDDGWLVGAPVLGVGANGHWGHGDLIVELDESFGTFSELAPFAIGLLNVEADHLDHYRNLAGVEAAFADLLTRTRGPVVAWGEDAGVARVLETLQREVVLVGTSPGFDWRVSDLELERRRASFVLRGPGETLTISLRVTGAHNVANAAVAAVLARTLGIAKEAVVAGLSNFVGAPRRYQYRGAWRGVDVYEDYAHLPGEIAATLEATRAAGYERVTVVFQPHRVTRTLALLEQFAPAFEGARHVVVTDLYGAGEANPTSVTGEVVADALGRYDRSMDTSYRAELADVVTSLDALVGDSDVILVLGAGDVGTIVGMLPGGLT